MISMKTKETINKAIDRLQAYYDCNHEVMDADDLGDLIETIDELKTMRNALAHVTTELIPEYVPGYDHTFIMEATYVDGECVSNECVGWYCGEPNATLTQQYANRQMKAFYEL